VRGSSYAGTPRGRPPQSAGLRIKIQWPERFLFASQVIPHRRTGGGVGLYYVIKNEDVSDFWTSLITLAITYQLRGTIYSVIAWGRRTDDETAALAAAKVKS
jgi:hypothetical protein